MTTMDNLSHTSSESYITSAVEFAERLNFPALEVAGSPVAAGRNGWGAFVASANRLQLVQALGIVIAKAHRERKA
jgi:hypothetical protein